MPKENDPIILACEAEWDNWKSDCSGFVKAVAARLGIPLRGNANQLVEFLGHSAEWHDLGHDFKAAKSEARIGGFVIGGLMSSPHGHVVIVVDLPSVRYPVGYWGQFGAVGQKAETINWTFIRSDLPKVAYFARKP